MAIEHMPSNYLMHLLQEIFKTDRRKIVPFMFIFQLNICEWDTLLVKIAVFLTHWQFYDQWLMKNHIAKKKNWPYFLVNTMSIPQCQLWVLKQSQNCFWTHCLLKQIYLRERSNGLRKNIWILLINKLVKWVVELQKVNNRLWLNRRIYCVRNFKRENWIT